MRLIDVDELIEYFDEDLEGYDNREYILHMLDSKGRSARVEAIPVEWILHYVDTHYNVDNFDGIWRYIMKMHDEWEKENDKETKELHQ